MSSSANKELAKISDGRILEALKLLALDPVPAKLYDVKKLKGFHETFRIRIGQIRIIYAIIWKDKTVLVSRISYRESSYD